MQDPENINAVLQAFVDDVVRLAKIGISAKRKARRSNGKIYYKRIDNTGKLRNSLRGNVNTSANSFSADIMMEEYGEWVDKGRKKGKGAPPSAIRKWIKQKPLRVRDAQGQFVKATESRINSLAYLINRKIKRKGIEATNFLTEPFELKFKNLPQEIIEAYSLDVEDFLRFTIDKLNKEYK